MKTSNIGLIGLAVMGENLALNMESKGFAVQKYGFSLNWQTIFVYFSSRLFY